MRLFAAMTIIALPLCFAYPQSNPSESAPRLVIDRTQHNFGEIFVGEILSTVFRVQNLGTKALELSDRPILTPRRVSSGGSESESIASLANASLNVPRRAAPS